LGAERRDCLGAPESIGGQAAANHIQVGQDASAREWHHATMTIDDREAILEVLSRYCHYVDGGEADKWAELFTEDGSFARAGGSFDIGVGPFSGRAALRKMASHFRADGLHFSANPVITVDGDEATVSSYVLVLQGREHPEVRMSGLYQDRLQKVDGQWLFSSRHLTTEMQRPLSS
jgi:hypothetical protein